MSQANDNYQEALKRIEQAKLNNTNSLSLLGLELTSLPRELLDLKDSLQKLDLRSNHLRELPDFIGEFTELIELDVGNNGLLVLNKRLQNLRKLTELRLDLNEISRIPEELLNIASLTHLNLYKNKIGWLSPKLVNLKNLEGLFLEENELNHFPKPISQLSNLVKLYLSENEINDIPEDAFDNLQNLEELTLFRTKLKKIPLGLCKLNKLRILALGDNYFDSFPIEMANLLGLEMLEMKNSKLVNFPLEITNLKNLNYLDLRGNYWDCLPFELGNLSNLESLYLSENYLEELPKSIGNLGNLKTIYLDRNRLSILPQEINNLRHLNYLDLGQNQLIDFPEQLLDLNQLEHLYLDRNQLTKLPSEIAKLRNLKRLYLDGNFLSTMPSNIVELENLEALLLHENQLQLPTEVLGERWGENKDGHLLLNYLRELEIGHPLNETKMLVVGQGGVGKTSLIHALIGKKFDAGSSKTEGIDIQGLELNLEDKRQVKLNIWDFGGQEIMHSTHQFFMTQRSIYLYVLNARDEQRANRPDYWLNLIEQYGGADAPIILVINKIDDNPILSLNEASLKRKYNIIGIYRTSCANGSGVEELQTAIHKAIEGLPHVSDNIPPTWAKVKEALEVERAKKDIIEYTSFSELCEKHGINETIRPAALRLFHDLGTVLNFYKEGSFEAAEDTKILNPEWVTDGVYAVINSTEIFKEKGVLEKNELRSILDRKRYPTNATREFILGMMEQFELAYPFDGGKRYLVPDLLSEIEPTIEGFEDTLNFEYKYTNFMPPSVMSRFIVRQHEKIKNREAELWKNGVVIHFEKLQALIRAENPSNKVTIAVQGDRNRLRELLAIVRDTFDSIHGSFAKLRVQAMVPIPDEEGAAVSYKALLAAEREGKSEVYVDDLDEYIDVRPLLEGVDGAISNRRLFNALKDRFSEDEIRTALFEVGIDYDKELSQFRGRTALARETVLFLERRGKIDAFVAEIRKSRPDIDL